MNYKKYKRFETIKLKDRTWPDNEITKAPTWCSVDLRDGNQALITPMKIEEKGEMFQLLVDLGFKEIEVGFPSSSQIEYDFLRILIDEHLIPDDVTVQVLTQAREHLIRRTFESLKGLDKAIVHVYNSTSVLQRDVVFHKEKDEIKQIAIDGVKLVKELSQEFDGKVILEYSPESFTGTEVDYALEVCEAVLDEWGASKENPVIINLPSTVEMDTPNVFFTSDMLNQETGYYEYEFEVEASFVTLNEKSSSDKYLVNPTFETPENLIIENIDNGKFRAKVKKEEIEKFIDGIEFDTICNGKKEKSRAYFSEICVDGNPNDEKYGRSYKTLTNVSENIISQEVSTYFGEKGIFVGYDVKDSIIRNKTHVETIFTLGKEIAVGNTYQIRCYPHSNTSKTYIYQTPASDGWAWLERTGDYKLDIIADTNLTNDGYQVEIFIPYSTFGLEKAPEELYILPCVSYYKDKNTLVTSQYHNQTGVSNYYTHDRSKFVTFDEKGYVTNSVSVEDIYLTDAQIIDGNYVADLICKDDQNNDYGIKEIKSHSNYFVKKFDIFV